MTVIEDIKRALEGIGYSVEDRPQEKTFTKQIIVIFDGMDIAVESHKSYRANTRITVNFKSDSSSDAIAKIKEMIQTIEPIITALNFKFESPELILDGRTFYISLPCIYTEVIRIE